VVIHPYIQSLNISDYPRVQRELVKIGACHE
jgi:hypothetical protein